MMEREDGKPNVVGVPNAPMALLSSAKNAPRNRSGC
jgi:hypothetical protein